MRRIGIEKITVGKTKLKRFLRHNSKKERKFGSDLVRCNLCGTSRAVIHKYKLDICRRCFKEVALKIGFRKLK